jgi:hypothetical protein
MRYLLPLGGHRGGFLKGRGSPHPKAFHIACGTVAPSASTSRKRKGPDEPSAGTSQDRQRRKLSPGGRTSPESSAKPICGNRPVVTMIIYWANNHHQVRALLDTGCSVPLISRELAGKLQLPLLKHEKAFAIENYTSNTENISQRKPSKCPPWNLRWTSFYPSGGSPNTNLRAPGIPPNFGSAAQAASVTAPKKQLRNFP